VHRLCDDHPNAATGLRILNVGFGLGIVGVTHAVVGSWTCLLIEDLLYTQIDSYFQTLPVPPSTHTIIEPHPDVLRHMRNQGWYDKEGVTILEGKWQDFVGTELLEDMAFDAVYTDTFSEEYEGEAFSFFLLRAHVSRHPKFVSKIYSDSSTTFQNSSPVQMLDLASSTDWERPVCLSLPVASSSRHSAHCDAARRHILRRIHTLGGASPGCSWD
jgi:hypothetical protein